MTSVMAAPTSVGIDVHNSTMVRCQDGVPSLKVTLEYLVLCLLKGPIVFPISRLRIGPVHDPRSPLQVFDRMFRFLPVLTSLILQAQSCSGPTGNRLVPKGSTACPLGPRPQALRKHGLSARFVSSLV